jgi:hypothetical protein
MVESRHQNYFDRAVYRNATRQERRALLDNFLKAVPDRVEAIRQFNATLTDTRTDPVLDAKFWLTNFFHSYRQPSDIYFGLSLMTFDSSVRAVGNDLGLPDTLCIGADVMATYRPEQVRIALVHEFFHLYHFGFLLEQPDWFDMRSAHARLMIEGMAIAATAKVLYGQPQEAYLNFSKEEFDRQKHDLAPNARRYLRLIRNHAELEEYGLWFTNLESDEAPPRGGYLIGYETVQRLALYYSLEQMARMSPTELGQHAEEQLAEMSGEQVLLLAGGRD